MKIQSKIIGDETSRNALHKLETKYAHYYDEMYPEFLKWMELENEALIEELKKRDGTQNTSLELGAGTGRQSWLLARAGFETYALDLSPQMVELGSKRIGERIQLGDARSFECSDKFGAVILGPLVATFLSRNSDVENALLCANRALEKDGLLMIDFTPARNIFAVPSYNGGIRKYEFPMKNGKITRFGEYRLVVDTCTQWEWKSTYFFELKAEVGTDYDRTILRAFWPSEAELLLRLCGFRIVSTLGYDGKEIGPMKDSNENLSFILIAEKVVR